MFVYKISVKGEDFIAYGGKKMSKNGQNQPKMGKNCPKMSQNVNYFKFCF